MTYGINLSAIVIFSLLLLALASIPMLLVLFGNRSFTRTRSVTGLIMTGAGITIGVAYLWAITAFISAAGPEHSGIVVEGLSPSGQEYCVVQTYTGIWTEPYQVSFYIRDGDGVWRWNYLEHEDLAWRSAQVEFADDKAIVSRNGKHFSEIPMPADSVDLATVLPGYRDEYCPATFTVAAILGHHNERFK
ncbi:MAG: hypothetical protein L3K26_04270 [Candidatus Hydrogenedentes bacterium]|nr:hypothetical protein [Candidatus Hydrogenedentota bacterium]